MQKPSLESIHTLLSPIYYFRNVVSDKPLLAVLTIGSILRVIPAFWGLNDTSVGLPSQAFSGGGESTFVNIVLSMGLNRDLNPHWFYYPSFFFYNLFALYVVTFLLFGKLDFITYLALGRFLTIFYGIATLTVVYHLGKELFSRQIGLISATLLAVATLHVERSFLMVVDVPTVFWASLALLYSCRIVRSGPFQRKNYFLAGIFTGLSFSTKYYTYLLPVVIPIAHYFYLINTKSESRIKSLLKSVCNSSTLVGLSGFFIAFFFGTPYSVLSFEEFRSYVIPQFAWNVGLDLQTHGYQGYARSSHLIWLQGMVWGLGLPTFLLSIAGVCLTLIRSRKGAEGILTAWLMLHILGTVTIIVVRNQQYLLPIYPVLAIFAAHSLSYITRIISRLRKTPPLRNILLATVLFLSFTSALSYDLALLRDTRYEAARWMLQNLPKNATMVVSQYVYVPNRFNHVVLMSWTRPNATIDLDSSNFQYVIISSYIYDQFLVEKELFPNISEFYRSLLECRTRYAPIACFQPLYRYDFYNANDAVYTFGLSVIATLIFEPERSLSGPIIIVYKGSEL